MSIKELPGRMQLWLWLLLSAFLIQALFAFVLYFRTDKYNTECDNNNNMAFQKIYNKKKFGCSYPIIIGYCWGCDTITTGVKIKRHVSYYEYSDGLEGGPLTVLIIHKSSFPSMHDTRLNIQKKYYWPFSNAEFRIINDSVCSSEIKLFKGVNFTEGPLVKREKKDWLGDRYRLKYDSAYYAVGYLYYKKWIYRICRSGTDTVGLREKVQDIRNSFDFSETRLKEPTFLPWQAVTITSAISLLLLACLLAGYWRVRRSFQSRAAKVVYLLHVLCLFIVLAVFLSLPDICFTSWMRGGLLCLLFACLGIGILLSMYHKALHKR